MNHYAIIKDFMSSEDSTTLILRINELISKEGTQAYFGRTAIENSKDEVLRTIATKYARKILETFPDSMYTSVSGYVFQHYSSKGFWSKHTDSEEYEEFSAFIYLNDEFKGGELVVETPYDETVVYKPVKNSLVYLPSWFPHSIARVPDGARYVLVINFASGYRKPQQL